MDKSNRKKEEQCTHRGVGGKVHIMNVPARFGASLKGTRERGLWIAGA